MPIVLEFPAEAHSFGCRWRLSLASKGQRDGVIASTHRHITKLQVQAEFDVFARTLARAYPTFKDWTRSRALLLQNQITGDTKRPLLLLFGATGLVLAVACCDIAGLVLTRSIERHRELQLRAAGQPGAASFVS